MRPGGCRADRRPPAHAQAGDLLLLETELTVGEQVLSRVTYTGFADNYSVTGGTLNFGSLGQSTFTLGSPVSSIRMLADTAAMAHIAHQDLPRFRNGPPC